MSAELIIGIVLIAVAGFVAYRAFKTKKSQGNGNGGGSGGKPPHQH